jgi:hypothetical protein
MKASISKLVDVNVSFAKHNGTYDADADEVVAPLLLVLFDMPKSNRLCTRSVLSGVFGA